MNDSISRQAAIDAVLDMKAENRVSWKDAVIDIIDELPSTQPEIIRCKDCKHRPVDGEDTQGFGVEFPDEICPCQCEDGWYNWRPNNEWYCANAESESEEADGDEEGRSDEAGACQ